MVEEVKEPAGLDMSLDALISMQQKQRRPQQDNKVNNNRDNRGDNRGGRFQHRSGPMQARGGVQKHSNSGNRGGHFGGNRQAGGNFQQRGFNRPAPFHQQGNYNRPFGNQQQEQRRFIRPAVQRNEGFNGARSAAAASYGHQGRRFQGQSNQQYGEFRGNAAVPGRRPQPRPAGGYAGADAGPPVKHNQLQCFVREGSGEVVVMLRDTEIVRVATNGDVTLNTGGWYSVIMLQGLNDVLNLIGIKVNAADENGDWRISDGRTLLRFSDGIRLPGKGATSRAQTILAAFQNPEAKTTAMAATAASTAAAIKLGILPSATPAVVGGFGGQSHAHNLSGMLQHRQSADLSYGAGAADMDTEEYGDPYASDYVRRLKAQGRYPGAF